MRYTQEMRKGFLILNTAAGESRLWAPGVLLFHHLLMLLHKPVVACWQAYVSASLP